jgi:hypothetical protein
MILTNNAALPDAFVRAVDTVRTPQNGRISCTELIKPPQIRALELQFWDEIEQDAGDMIELFLGNAVHHYLAHFGGEDALVEERMQWRDPASGWIVHGTPDSMEWVGLTETGVCLDWKTSTVRALKYDRDEWTAQTNVYAHLARLNGYQISALEVWVILRDYDRQRRHDPTYPRSSLVKVPVKLWEEQVAHEYLLSRLRLHRAAARGIYPSCTAEDRWQRDTWAVVGHRNERASAVFDNRELAVEYAEARTERPRRWEDWWAIDKRAGQPLRCQSWCHAAPHCGQYQSERAEAMKVGT